MHTANIAAFAGVGFLAMGTILSLSDLGLARTSFELLIGPVLWIVGCALMVAWAIARIGLAVKRKPDNSDESESTQAKEATVANRTTKPEAAASGSDRRAVAGKAVADFLVPVAIWLMFLSFVAALVLLLGNGPA